MIVYHVLTIEWLDDKRCRAVCSCGWVSAPAATTQAVRAIAWVHRMAQG